MPRPGVGNPGNKGGGRKSAYQEARDAQALNAAFFDGVTMEDINEVENFLNDKYDGVGRTKKLPLFKYMLVRAIKNDKVLIALMKKVFPDKFDGQSEVKGLAEALKALHNGEGVEQPQEDPEEMPKGGDINFDTTKFGPAPGSKSVPTAEEVATRLGDGARKFGTTIEEEDETSGGDGGSDIPRGPGGAGGEVLMVKGEVVADEGGEELVVPEEIT